MIFNSICLVTEDVIRLTNFYEQALRVKVEGDREYAKIQVPGAQLTIFSREGMERMAPGSTSNCKGSSIVIEVEVADVDKEYERLKKLQVSFVKQPTTQPWGVRSVWFTDPDGNIINFYAKV